MRKGLAKEAAAQQMRRWHAKVEMPRRHYVSAVRNAKDALAEAHAALAHGARQLQGNPLA